MAPSPRLELSQGQEQKQLQVLDARQLQSLKIMQKPLQELRNDILAELATNPVLEEVSVSGADSLPAAGAFSDEDTGDTGNDRGSEDYSEDVDRYEASRDGGGDAAGTDRHGQFIESLAAHPSVADRLLGQLYEEALPDPVRRAGEYLVGSLEQDGTSTLTASELASAAGVSPEEAEEAIRIVGGFDFTPPRNDDAGIAFLVPEVAILREPGGGYSAELLPGALPVLRIAKLYRDLAAAPATDAETKKYLSGKLRSGEFWIDSLARRNATVLAIAREIARFQAPFFDHGLDHLKPMTLAEMGDRVGMHETTVGRAIDGKSALTPQGTCPLRMFFTHAVRHSAASSGGVGEETGTEDGESVSTLAVRAVIRKLVQDEDPAHPLSDQALAEVLREKGFPVARRTVAKYREQLEIAPSHLRRAASRAGG